MKPWLWLPPKWSHGLAPIALPMISFMSPSGPVKWRSLDWKGLHFPNPVGLAGGVDKAGGQLLSWQKLGAGFLEVGTITPRPQGPNPGTIMDRDNRTFSVWNKMGFPNPGAEKVRDTLDALKHKLEVPLFINIGKNRDTDNAKAIQDYIEAYRILKDCGKVFVINISSPNTKGLRDLQDQQYLQNFLREMRAIASEKQLLVKLSPDMSKNQLKDCLDLCVAEGINGTILTNTTTQRSESFPYPINEGGVSGAPLKSLSRSFLTETIQHLGTAKKDFLVVSVGGILNEEEIQWRLQAGADLVQVYTALIYNGPYFFRKVASHQWQ